MASQSDVIYSAPSAMVGSIGVLLPLIDTSGLYEKNGIKVDAIAAGKYKSTGLDGTTLTDEQRPPIFRDRHIKISPPTDAMLECSIMKRITLPCLLTLASSALAAPSAPVDEAPTFQPIPKQLEMSNGKPGFSLAEGIRIDAATSHSPMGRALIRELQAAGVPVLPEEVKGDVTICIANHWDFSWYELEITPDHITIGVAYPTTIPQVVRTLAQAKVRDREGHPALPAMKLETGEGRTPFGPPKEQ